jgi:hypothetical protein
MSDGSSSELGIRNAARPLRISDFHPPTSQPRRHEGTKKSPRPPAPPAPKTQRRRGAEAQSRPPARKRKGAKAQRRKGAGTGIGCSSASWRQNGRRSDRPPPVRSGRSPNARVRRRRASHQPPCPGHGGSASRTSHRPVRCHGRGPLTLKLQLLLLLPLLAKSTCTGILAVGGRKSEIRNPKSEISGRVVGTFNVRTCKRSNDGGATDRRPGHRTPRRLPTFAVLASRRGCRRGCRAAPAYRRAAASSGGPTRTSPS